jgi:hypothetical protein
MKYLAVITVCNPKIQKQLAPGNTLGGAGGTQPFLSGNASCFHRDLQVPLLDVQPQQMEHARMQGGKEKRR